MEMVIPLKFDVDTDEEILDQFVSSDLFLVTAANAVCLSLEVEGVTIECVTGNIIYTDCFIMVLLFESDDRIIYLPEVGMEEDEDYEGGGDAIHTDFNLN